MRTSIIIILTCILSGTASFCAGMDDAALKEWLTSDFNGPESMLLEEELVKGFRERFAVTDDQLHRVLMALYREADDKRAVLTPKTQEWRFNQRIVEGVIYWLPQCGKIPIKDFLMDYAASKENDPYIRSVAVLSYLRAADAEETKSAMLRFLIGEDRMDDQARSSIYIYARMIWDAASPEKKAAISLALCEAASVESPQWVFEECDSVLLLMDPAWRDSSQRESMLRRQLSLPFSKYYTELKTQMEKEIERIEKVSAHSINNTNLAVIAPQGFSRPTLGLLTNEVAGSDREDSGSEPETTVSDRSPSKYAFFGLLALLLLGFGAWRLMRK